MSISIKEIDTPQKRLLRYGIENLTDEELLAILFSSDNQKIKDDLLNSFNNISELFSASIEELLRYTNQKEAYQIKILYELGKRIFSFQERYPQITSTDDVVKLLFPMMHLKQEEFRVVLLNSKNKVIGLPVISKGSLDQTTVYPRDVLRPAIVSGACFIILVHNHPSGDPTPSEQDILLTRELCLCGKVMGIEVIDHVIIGTEGYISFKLRKLM